MCGFLQLGGEKWGKSGPRGWCVIPRDDPLVLYVYAAPQVMPPGPPALAFSPRVGMGEGILLAHSSDVETEAQCRHSSLGPHRIRGFQSWAQTPGHNCVVLKGRPVLLSPGPPPALPSRGRGAWEQVCDCGRPRGWMGDRGPRLSPPSQDIRAHTSIPLLGYQVTAGPQGDPRAFQLQQSGLLYTFRADSEELRGRWVRAMERAAGGWSPGDPADGDLSD